VKKHENDPTHDTELRRQAEARLSEQELENACAQENLDAQRLVQELQVHQVELELQNEELRNTRDEASKWLDWYTDLYDFAPVGYYSLDRDGSIRHMNLTGARLLHVDRSRLLNRRFGLFVSRETRAVFNAFLDNVFERREENRCEVVLQTENGGSMYVQIVAAIPKDGEDCRIAVVDITERKLLERRQLLSTEILGILNEHLPLSDAINRILVAIKEETGFDAVGFRLQSGKDFPYFAQYGFSDDFLLAENTLVTPDRMNGICRDGNGEVDLECTCGLVISGCTDPTSPLFTANGSFWTNNALPLRDIPPDQDPRLNPRNICIHEGFLSVALIPIRANKRIVGLLQLNDRKTDRLTLAMIQYFEGVSASLGLALMNRHAEEALAQSNEREHRILESISDAFFSLDREWRFTYVNNGAERILLKSREELIGTTIWEQFPEAVGSIFQTEYERAMLGDTTVQFEGYYPPFAAWFEVLAYPYRGGLSVYFRDCTERHLAHEASTRAAERIAHIADMLQSTLIPPLIPLQPAGYETAARYQPALTEAEVGGDFYDLFDLGDGKLGVVIGDIVGKGLPAAARVAAVRHTIRSYAFLDLSPSRVMTLVSDALFRNIQTENDMLTAFFAVIDIRTGGLTYANAGHEPPVIMRSNGQIEFLDTIGPMFNGMSRPKYPESELTLQPGDLILMITDGITEARKGDYSAFFGVEGIVGTLSRNVGASADEIAAKIFEDASSFADDVLRDDVAIVVIKSLNDK